MRKNSPTRVLIVEDVELEAVLLRQILADVGYSNVVHCSDVEAALADVEKNDTRIVITDHSLGKTTGIDLTKKLRERPTTHYVYVIMLTSHRTDDRVRAAFDAGVDDFVAKPYRHDDLIGRLRVAERIVLLETCLRVRSEELETALRRIDVSAAQRALAKAAEVVVGPARGGDPLDALVSTPAWRDAEALLAAAMKEFFQSPFDSGPLDDAPKAPFVAQIVLTDPTRELEVSLSVVVDERSLRSFAAHILGDGEDIDSARALVLEVANIMMGTLKTSFGGSSFAFIGGIPATVIFAERRAAFGTSAARARLGLRSAHGAMEVWLQAQSKKNRKVQSKALEEGMVLSEDVRDANGLLLIRGGTRLTRVAAERIARAVPDREFEVSSAQAA